jgi:hypothetical protein
VTVSGPPQSGLEQDPELAEAFEKKVASDPVTEWGR